MRFRACSGLIVSSCILLAPFAWTAAAQDCVDPICIETERQGDALHFYVVNQFPGDVTIRFDLDLQNMQADVSLPHVASFAGRSREVAFTLRQDDPLDAWRFNYRYAWRAGRLEARHDNAYVYDLPYAARTAHRVVQGFNGDFSHKGNYALDWAMPEGTPVHAARGGLVVSVRDSFTVGGLDESLRERANMITIRHQDGTLGMYAHLQPYSAAVRVGQHVTRGQLLGRSGNTGFSSGPHLHFEVYTIDRLLRPRSVPIRFATAGGITELDEGKSYRAER